MSELFLPLQVNDARPLALLTAGAIPTPLILFPRGAGAHGNLGEDAQARRLTTPGAVWYFPPGRDTGQDLWAPSLLPRGYLSASKALHRAPPCRSPWHSWPPRGAPQEPLAVHVQAHAAFPPQAHPPAALAPEPELWKPAHVPHRLPPTSHWPSGPPQLSPNSHLQLETCLCSDT